MSGRPEKWTYPEQSKHSSPYYSTPADPSSQLYTTPSMGYWGNQALQHSYVHQFNRAETRTVQSDQHQNRARRVQGFRQRKSISEKKRRQRMNDCIDKLKDLMSQDTRVQLLSEKPEKVEILEIAVEVMKGYCGEKISNIDSFVNGYTHCTSTMTDYLASLGAGPVNVEQLLRHVKSKAKDRSNTSEERVTDIPKFHAKIWQPW